MRLLTALVLVALALISPSAVAEEPTAPGITPEVLVAPEAEWQNIITLQIEAFREGDGVVALSFAGQGFKAAFPDPNQFYMSIVNAGYGPLVLSRSHSFGPFELVGDIGVIQTVKIVGPDQHLYKALYQLAKEPEGWRVQGVQLTEEDGIGI